MAIGAKLHTFDLELCGYIRSVILEQFADRDLRQTLEEDLSDRSLIEYLAGEGASQASHERLLLNNAELLELESAVENAAGWGKLTWSPYLQLHARHVYVIPEIQKHLPKATAEDWASASRRWSEILSDENLPLREGVATVAKWIRHECSCFPFMQLLSMSAAASHSCSFCQC